MQRSERPETLAPSPVRGAARSARSPKGRGPREVPLVELDVPTGPAEHWLREVTDRWHVGVRLRLCRPTGVKSEQLLQVVELSGAPADLGNVERHLRERPELRDITVLGLSPSRRYLRIAGPMPEGCRRLFASGAVCATCRFLPTPTKSDGDARWSLIVPRDARTMKAVARTAGIGGQPAPILRMRRFVPPRNLTRRQAAAIETAVRLGFYEFPRRTNLKEIARILRISRATTLEHLRRAEAKLLTSEFAPLEGDPVDRWRPE